MSDSEGQSSLRRNGTVVAALITAIIALGVAVFGWIREEEARETSARGAARLMQAEFLVRYCDLRSAFKREIFPKVNILQASGLEAEQRLQVAAQMDAEDWSAVAKAEALIPRTERLLRRRPGARFSRPGRTESQRRTIEAEIGTLAKHRDAYKSAFRALASDVAGAFSDVGGELPCPPVEARING